MEIIHEPHDSLFKLVFSIPQHTRAELLAVLPPALVQVMDLATLQPLPGSFVDPEFRKAFTDLLFSVVIRGHEARIYLLLEHQSTGDRWMALRLWSYVDKIWRAYLDDNPRATRLPLVIPLVIHHGATPWSAATSMDQLLDLPAPARDIAGILDDKLPRLGYFLDDLTVEQDDDLRGRSMAALPRLALWAMKHARHSQDFVTRMYQWADVFRQVVQAPSGVQALAMLLRYILQVSDTNPDDIATFTTELGKPAREAFMTGAEVLEQRGELRGELRGEQRGELRGEQRTLRSVLEIQLQQRFGALPPAVAERIQQASTEKLRRWIDRVVIVATLDQVFDTPADSEQPAR